MRFTLLARPQVRQRLPILAIRQQLVEALQRQDVVVVSGDTGCGKTTQVGAPACLAWLPLHGAFASVLKKKKEEQSSRRSAPR